MAYLNRRELVAGAAALLGQAHVPFALAVEPWSVSSGNGHERESGPPKDLLSSTFTASVLERSLLSVPAWHPYPRVEEREAWQRVPKEIGGSVLRRAEAVLGTEWATLPATAFLEFKRMGNRSHFEQLYFVRRQRLTDLTLAECIEGKGRFLDEIANGVWLTCEETFWGLPAHLSLQRQGPGLPDMAEPVVDLFAAETGATLSWVDYLVGARLAQVSPLIRPRIQMEAKRRILDPALERNDFWWMGLDGKGRRMNNWNPWINSNWLFTNLLLEQDPARRLSATVKICRSLDRYLADYSPDGGCEEGPVYWGVAAASYFDCCATLTSATGGAASVLTRPFIGKMAHYIADVHIAHDYYVNYGDAHAKDGPSPELIYRIGTGVGDKVLEKFGAFYTATEGVRPTNGRLARELPDVLTTEAALSAPRADALERDSWYPALGLMTARAKAGTSDGLYLAVQAAKNSRSHGHNDSGSFIVFHNGEPVFIDVGVEAYTAKTFSAQRDSIWTMQSAYHNLPTVGGVMQSGRENKYGASDVRYVSDGGHAGLSMNLAPAYPADAGIQSWIRTIALERAAGRIQLTEDFKLRRKVPVALSFMTPRVPSQGAGGRVILRVADKTAGEVALTYDPSLAVPSFEKIVLTDEGMRNTWGGEIYRVLLTSKEPVESGKWTLEMSE